MEAAAEESLGDETLSLSLSQHDVWLDQRAWPQSVHLNIGGGTVLRGALDEARLRAALAILVAESEALRLAPQADGSQRLLPHVAPALELVDLSDALDPEAAMRHWWRARIGMPFSWDGAPPWRFALLRGGPELHGITLQFHHIVMDGWGTTRTMQRWSELYESTGAAPDMAAPRYRQFIAESQSYRQSDAFGRDAAYWRAQFPALPAPVITRRQSSPGGGRLSASHLSRQRMPRAAYQLLESDTATSAFHYFLAALALYFSRINQGGTVVIGVPTLNRGGRHFKSTLGMFVGVLAIPMTVSAAMPVHELLAATRLAMRGALRHARYPLSELGRALGVLRSGRDGLIDVMLSFERQDFDLSFGGARLVETEQLFPGVARYPLGVTVCDFGAGQDPELVLDASADCFGADETDLLGRRLWHVAAQLQARPGACVDDIDLVPPAESRALLDGRHKDVAHHAAPLTWLAQYERQALATPDACALVWDGGSCDYAGLDRRAALLAASLKDLGAGPDVVVAFAIERSPAMVLAMLAIAKAGAAFLPLDPEAPLERIADILHQSQACALLVTTSHAVRLGELHPRTHQVHWSAAPPAPVMPCAAKPRQDQLAYVLFTSGSTGRPKGVMVEHATLSRRLAWIGRAYAADARDCAAQATQITFDPALIELLLPLVNGARVALPPPGRLLPETLAAFALRHGVTIMAFVPSTLSRFLDGVNAPMGLKLRMACCGGEVLAPALARRFLAQTGAQLFNVYGPTETCIFGTAWKCMPDCDDAPLPLGRPIDDTRIYVLDARARLVPTGAPGEIYIGGDTLARGYLNRPELDLASFVDDPFRPGERMYRTGDRGWLGTGGELHFLGRNDRQVKLRGYRIELGEIEAICLLAPGVVQAAARLVDAAGKPQLHAWVGAREGVTVYSVLALLRQRLPDYMVPSALCVLPALAESSAGKIDYAALPLLKPFIAPVPGMARAPSNTFERALLPMWEALLEARPIGMQDNFFDLGGDSLAAVSLLSSIEAVLGRKVSMYVLSEHPTIETLALALGKRAIAPGMLVAVGPGNGRTPLYLAASGHGDLLRFRDLGRALADCYDVFMLQPPTDRAIASVAELAELYADCIEAQGREAGVVAGFSVGGVAALETARLLQSRGGAVRALVLIDTINPSAVLGGTAAWRVLGWLVRNLRVQELSINGRRLGALFNDPGLIGQVMALRGYRAAPFTGHTVLIRSSGLANWDRMFFGTWRRLMGVHLVEQRVRGLHGSMFEAGNVQALAGALAKVVSDQHAAH
ncbi:MAG: amino acid adenylation domain-containing protein [Pseudomonadota bacterium]